MRLFGKATPRQKEIRRSKSERLPAWYRRVLDAGTDPGPLLILLLCAMVGGVLINFGAPPLPVQAGERVPRAITSRVRFDVLDEARTAQMKTQAYDNADVYYTLDVSLVQDVQNRLTSALRIAKEQIADPNKIREQVSEINITLDDNALAELVRIAGLSEASLYERAVERGVQELRRRPLVEADDKALRRTAREAILLDPERATEIPTSVLKLQFSNDTENVLQVARAAATEFPPPLRESIQTSIMRMLRNPNSDTYKPLYRFDAARSAQAADAAKAAVPPQYDVYKAGDVLVSAGIVSADQLGLLRQEHRAYLEWVSNEPVARQSQLAAAWSRGALCFLILFGLGGYVLSQFGRQLGMGRQLFASVLALLLVLALARVSYIQGLPYFAIGIQAFIVILLALTTAGTIAPVTSGLLALAITLGTQQSAGFVLVLIGVSLVLLYGLRDVRNRGRIITIGFFAAIAAAGTTVLTGLVDGQSLWFILRAQAMWSGLGVLAAAFLVEGLLPTLEQFFGVTTNMTLLEWCDPNKPLMRMLAAEAPGTYNHSLLVGTLADAAADAIGANGLLARTGAYYHDIGKINKPGYFVENQALDVGNRHERLSPAMSHLIIIGHVKDGIEMAKEYHLPTVLRPFIPEHHGTCVVEYFYHAANQARKPGDPAVSDEQFRYPGPKPQSRETAIIMLCDGVEGAVRAMPEPTPNRIEDTVDRIIQKRLIDGQLDDCDLTFRELDIIRRSLVKSLNSIYHGRIAYPTSEPTPATSRSAS